MDCLNNKPVRWAGVGFALLGGAVAGLAASNGGPLTELHERCHALANWILTTRPSTVAVDTWKAWSHVAEAKGLKEKFWETIEVISGTYGGGGVTSFGSGEKRWLGNILGPDLTDLVISASGQGSTLLIHSTAVLVGVHQRKKRSALAAFLIAFAIIGHLAECDYALSALRMSSKGLIRQAQSGHDFACIADVLSDMSGLYRTEVAYGVALAWTVSVPTIGLGLALVT